MGRIQGNTSPTTALQTLLEEEASFYFYFFVCVLSPMGYFELLLTGWCLEEIRPSNRAEGTLEVGMPTMQWVRSLMPFC